MITNGIGAVRSTRVFFGLTATLLMLSGATGADAAGSLLEQCWSPAQLAGLASEKPPVRGAPGHARSIPAVALPSTSPIPQRLQGSIRRVRLPKGKKLIALTFDMCEQAGEVAGYDGAIVDYLRASQTRATFFTGGKWLLTHAERAQQLMADPRFEIGDHGWTHRNVRGLGGQALDDEVGGPQRAYQVIRAKLATRQCAADLQPAMHRIAPRMTLYRFPYGACNPQALSKLASDGLLAVQWDVSGGDPTPTASAADIARGVAGSVRPGSIVLLHANGRGYNTAAALHALVPRLKAMGYEMVTVSELLAAGEPEISPTCYDHHVGDTDRYDRLFAPRLQPARAADGHPRQGTAERAIPGVVPRAGQ